MTNYILNSLWLLTILFFSNSVSGAEAIQVKSNGQIVTQNESNQFIVEVGTLVEIDASTLGNGSARWLLATNEQYYLETDQGKKLIFTAPQKGYFIFVLSHVAPEKEAPQNHTLTKIVIATKEGDVPRPPHPNPLGCDDKPEGKYGLPRFTCQLIKKHVSVADNQKFTQQKSLVKQAVFDLRLAVNGGTTMPKDAINMINTQLDFKLQQDKSAWSEFGINLQAKLKQLESDGKITNSSECVEAFNEIVKGLD